MSSFLRRLKLGRSIPSTTTPPPNPHTSASVGYTNTSRFTMSANSSSFLQNKVAVITGASKGIGKASAIALARLGATVVINYSSDEQSAQETLAEVKKIGSGEARIVRADVGSVAGAQSLVKQAVDAYSKIDVLVANAGVMPMMDLEHTTEEAFDRTFAVNVKGPYFLAQASLFSKSPANLFVPRRLTIL